VGWALAVRIRDWAARSEPTRWRLRGLTTRPGIGQEFIRVSDGPNFKVHT